MDQNGLRDLLLTLAAQAGAEYEKVLIDRNSKFDEITLLGHKMDELKTDTEDQVFSPRSKLSSYDARRTFEEQIAREKLVLNRLDSELDTLLNRKEELLEGVELLDSILEEREEYYEKVKELSGKKEAECSSTDEEVKEESKTVEADEVVEKKIEEKSEDVFTPSVSELLNAISCIAYQCGEISNFTIQDPYRARNELRSIANKWGRE